MPFSTSSLSETSVAARRELGRAVSPTRITTAVMLSWPPPLFADVDEPLRHVLDVAVGELLGQLGLVDVGVHAVGAEQEAIAGQDVEVERVDLDRAVDADRARDRVLVLLVRRALDLLAVELAAADQLVHQRVVLGEDVALVLAREVDAAVADVRDEAAQVIAGAGDRAAPSRSCPCRACRARPARACRPRRTRPGSRARAPAGSRTPARPGWSTR